MPHRRRSTARHAGRARVGLGALVGLACLAACTKPSPAPLTPAARAVLARADSPPDPHLPLAPERLQHLLETAPLHLVAMKPAGAGVMGVFHATVSLEGAPKDVEIKWKTAPAGRADGWNNTPRKEIAAYEIQRWFLDPDDYVVPPTAVRCVPLDEFRRFVPDAEPTTEGTRCVLGMVSAWLQDVREPHVLYEPDRFLNDPRYAYNMANWNLLLYLIEQRDGRAGNFLEANDPTNRRLFAIDNGIAFGGKVHNFLVLNWDEIRVPAVRHASVDRLRRIGPTQLDQLAVVAELRADAAGVLRPVRPGPVVDPNAGTRVAPGWLQMGLTRDEITAVGERIRTLIARVDAGELAAF